MIEKKKKRKLAIRINDIADKNDWAFLTGISYIDGELCISTVFAKWLIQFGIIYEEE